MQEISEIGAALHAAAESGPGCSRAELEALVERLEEQTRAAAASELFGYPAFGEPAAAEAGTAEAGENAAQVVSAVATKINERNDKRYTPLHSALFAMNLAAVELFIDLGADVNLKCHGTPALHLAVAAAALPAPGAREFGGAATSALLHASYDLSAKDDLGATALHLAAELNLPEIITLILDCASTSSKGEDPSSEEKQPADESLSLLLEAKDRNGQRPVHRAAECNAVAALQTLLAAGARVSSVSIAGATPLHVAASGGSPKAWALLCRHGADPKAHRDLYGRNAEECAAAYGWTVHEDTLTAADGSNLGVGALGSTAVLTHPYCLQHHTCVPSEADDHTSAPPENINRLKTLINKDSGVLRSKDLSEDAVAAKRGVVWVEDARPASMSDVLRVHEWSYVRRVQATCDSCSEDPEAEGGLRHLDGDTALSKLSFEAALRGAGSVCQAVDMVMRGEVRNAFCAVRPPGHHAGPRGTIPGVGADSHGFCLLNNISIGAAYAMNMHRDTVRRVAIIDFDVHHGNGTEETVRWLTPGLDHTEINSPFALGMIATPRYKPWFDATDHENVMFVSVHGFGPRERGLEYAMPAAAFYPGTGATHFPSQQSTFNHTQSHSAAPAPGPMQFSDENAGTDNNIMDSHDADASDSGSDADFDPDMASEVASVQSDDTSPEHQDEPAVLRAVRAISTGKLPTKLAKSIQSFLPKTEPYTNAAASSTADGALVLDVGVHLPSEDESPGSYRHQWRNYFRDSIFPRIIDFKPDLIFLSAGFDAHKKDTINSGYIALIEDDYEWITRNLMHIANSSCNGRIVSALEGGYQLLGQNSSAFAKSVKRHVTWLTHAAVDGKLYSAEDSAVEKEFEHKLIEDQKLKAEAKLSALLNASSQQRPKRRAAVAAASAVSAELDASEGDGQRKRRRAAAKEVDYAQLDKELREQENKPSDVPGAVASP